MKRSTIEALNDFRARRISVVVVKNLQTGAELIVEERHDNVPNGLAEAVDEAFRTNKSRIIEAGENAWFVQSYAPVPRLFVIGAVHVTQHLVPFADAAGYDPVVIDPRTAFATEERFKGVNLIAEWPQDALKPEMLDARSGVVALTHDPKIDDPALELALEAPCFYIGALGSRRTHATRVERLQSRGFDDEKIARIQAPIGLDIGAQGPAEIAISIMAEITACLRLRKDIQA